MDGDVKKLKQVVTVSQFLLPNNLNGAAQLIPIDLCGRLVSPSVSINELGKKLLKASVEGNVDEIKLLLNQGAPFTADWLGTSPLHFAAQNNHLEVCEILLKAGISKDARTKVDRTPLHIAVYEGHVDIVQCLLLNDADINCKDLLSMTPLHWAAQNCHAEIAALLVRYGAEINVANKFNLTPSDIALQCERPDIAEIINLSLQDADIAAQSLTLEMNEMDNSLDSAIYNPIETLEMESNVPAVPIAEAVLLEDVDSENSIDPERLHINQEETAALNHKIESPVKEIESEKFSESFRLLQQHGITMLPADDTNILSSILEAGHSVVLTDVGKQVLNSTKPVENTTNGKIIPKFKTVPAPTKPKKVITITPQEFLAMTLNKGDMLKQLNGKFTNLSKPTVKRIVMKKNKIVPITNSNVIKSKHEAASDIEMLMKQLIEARKLVEVYKQKFLKKQAEAEKYKQQLLLLSQSKNNYF